MSTSETYPEAITKASLLYIETKSPTALLPVNTASEILPAAAAPEACMV